MKTKTISKKIKVRLLAGLIILFLICLATSGCALHLSGRADGGLLKDVNITDLGSSASFMRPGRD